MKQYELTFLISPDLSPEELISFQEKIISYLQQEKGILVKINKAIKKNLDRLVNKKSQAFLLSLDFQLNPGGLENLEKKLKAENQILRYFLSVKKEGKAGEIIEKVTKLSKRIQRPKVELKEIEKKLDEILGE